MHFKKILRSLTPIMWAKDRHLEQMHLKIC
jgi:hypothetical protein